MSAAVSGLTARLLLALVGDQGRQRRLIVWSLVLQSVFDFSAASMLSSNLVASDPEFVYWAFIVLRFCAGFSGQVGMFFLMVMMFKVTAVSEMGILAILGTMSVNLGFSLGPILSS